MLRDGLVSIPWYKWMFAGTHDRAYEQIREMKAYAAAHGIRFTVVPLPAGSAYGGEGTYALDAMYDDIDRFLSAEGLLGRDARTDMAAPAYYDPSDHLTAAGNERMVAVLSKVVAP